MKSRIKISVDVVVSINQCSLRKSTSKAQVFKTVKFSIDFIQRSDLIYSLSKKEPRGKTKFAIISVKTVKLAMENVHSLF